MKSYVIAGVAAGLVLCALNAFAEGNKTDAHKAKGEKAIREMPALAEMTVTGKIVKEEMTKKDKDGNEIKAAKFVLKTADATMYLPPTKDIDFAAYADKDVTIEGMGFEKNGKKMLRKITKVSEAAPAAQ